MTGVSDLPFRETATALGAPYVATEMVACAEFARGRPDVVRRAAVGEGLPLMVVQLVGRDPGLMAKGARMAADAGAQIIDLNFGCPAKEVSGGQQSGSAIMREPDLAEALVSAAVEAVDVPVTVKMRLGWDDNCATPPTSPAAPRRPAPRRSRFTAARAASSTRASPTGAPSRRSRRRSRCRSSSMATSSTATRPAWPLEQSGADGVMIGRGVYGRPWIASAIEAALEGRGFRRAAGRGAPGHRAHPFPPQPRLLWRGLGLKMFRKHLASYIEAAPWPETAEARRAARATLCRLEDPDAVERPCATCGCGRENSRMTDRARVLGGVAPEALKAAAFDLSPEPALVVDREGGLVAVNEAAEALFGHGLSLLARGRFRAALPPGSVLVSLLDRAIFEGALVREHGVEVNLFGQPPFEADGAAAPLGDGSVLLTLHVKGVLGVDKAADAAGLRSVVGLGRMLAHEIKNPLAGIRGAAQLLKTGASAVDQPLAQLIVDETDRIRRLVDRMEAFSDEVPTRASRSISTRCWTASAPWSPTASPTA
jgi:tRNA-dihydrouridine synthase